MCYITCIDGNEPWIDFIPLHTFPPAHNSLLLALNPLCHHHAIIECIKKWTTKTKTCTRNTSRKRIETWAPPKVCSKRSGDNQKSTQEKKWERSSDLCGHGQRWKKLREILKCERANLNCWDKHHPRLKQRINNLTLTNDQFKSEFIKKTKRIPILATIQNGWMNSFPLKVSFICTRKAYMWPNITTLMYFLTVVLNLPTEKYYRWLLIWIV